MTDFCNDRVCVGCGAHLRSPAGLHLMSQGSRALPRLPCLRSNLRHQREGEAAARFRAFVATELRGGRMRRVLSVHPGCSRAAGAGGAGRCPACPACTAHTACTAARVPLGTGMLRAERLWTPVLISRGLSGNDPKKKGDNKRQLLGGKSLLNSVSVPVRLPL